MTVYTCTFVFRDIRGISSTLYTKFILLSSLFPPHEASLLPTFDSSSGTLYNVFSSRMFRHTPTGQLYVELLYYLSFQDIIVFRIDPRRLSRFDQQISAEEVNERNARDSNADHNRALHGKSRGIAIDRNPGVDEERISESTEIEDDRVECDDAHGLERVAVHDVGRQDRVAGLKAHREHEECELTDHPVPALFDACAPEHKADSAHERSWICQPQAHCRFNFVAVLFRKATHECIAESAGANEFG